MACVERRGLRMKMGFVSCRLDVNSVEGANSCIRYVATAATWSNANATCGTMGPDVHLLTSRQV